MAWAIGASQPGSWAIGASQPTAVTGVELLAGTIDAQSTVAGNVNSVEALAGSIAVQSGATGNLDLVVLGANPKGPLGHPLCGALAGPISF